MKFHAAFERSVARILYKDSWGTSSAAIMKQNGYARCNSEVLIRQASRHHPPDQNNLSERARVRSTPRRFGKTFRYSTPRMSSACARGCCHARRPPATVSQCSSRVWRSRRAAKSSYLGLFTRFHLPVPARVVFLVFLHASLAMHCVSWLQFLVAKVQTSLPYDQSIFGRIVYDSLDLAIV